MRLSPRRRRCRKPLGPGRAAAPGCRRPGARHGFGARKREGQHLRRGPAPVLRNRRPGQNCQIGVFAAYASARGRALVDRELCLPKSWTEDRERCRTAKVPEEREFATKGELARHMVLRALASPLPIARVTADSAYGQDNRFGRLLEQSGVGYVLAVAKSQFSVGCSRIEGLFAQAPDEAWRRWREGASRLPLGSGAAASRRRIRLSGRGPSPNAVGTGPAQHQQAGRDRLLPRLRTPSGHRPRVGTGRRGALSDRGVLPGREERVRPGPVRGSPLRGLVSAHHSGHARSRFPGRYGTPALGIRGGTGETPGAIGLTVAEVRRLLAACRARPSHLSGHRGRHHTPSWSNWRRRRQAVARLCHYLWRCRAFEGRSP